MPIGYILYGKSWKPIRETTASSFFWLVMFLSWEPFLEDILGVATCFSPNAKKQELCKYPEGYV